MLWHNKGVSFALVYFDPKIKVNCKDKFSHFYVHQLFSADAKMYREPNFVFVLTMKIWKNYPPKNSKFAIRFI